MQTLPNSSTTDPYGKFQSDPSQENLANVVRSLDPTINYALGSIGAAKDPVMRTRARVVAAEAVRSYDPTKSQLKTHVSNQLQRMGREYRARRAPVKIPERTQLDTFAITRAEEEYFDEFGREPTVSELAERTRLTPKRIEKIRSTSIPVVMESAFEEGHGGPTQSETDWDKEALEYVYGDGDRIDKKIIEWTTGLYGAKPVPPKEIAQRLKLAPYQLTRRRIRISKMVQDIVNDLKEVGG